MPSPATPHRPSNRGGPNSAKSSPAKQKPLDIGQPLGIYDTNSVRSKVRKWQQHGGGVITADEVVYYDEDEENSTESPSKPAAKEKPTLSAISTSTTTTTRKRSKSTPRKRVISDEHWKLNRSSTQTPPPKFPTPKRISEYTTNDALVSPRAGRSETKGEDKPRAAASSRNAEKSKPGASDSSSRDRRKSRASRDVDSIITSKIDEEDASHNGSSRGASRPGSAGKPQAAAKSELSETAGKKDGPAEDDDWTASEADFSELSRRRAKGPNPAPKGQTRAPLKVPKNGIFGHMFDESKKMFGRPESPKTDSVKPGTNPPRGSKIEAWLSGTSDPFTIEGVDPDVEVPAPLNTKSSRAKHSPRRAESRDRTIDTDPDSDTREPRRRSTAKRRVKSREERSVSGRAKPSADEKAASKESLREVSSSSGRRSGERRRSRASSGAKESLGREKATGDGKGDMSDAETQPFSDGSEVSSNNAPVPPVRKRPIPHRLSTIMSVDSLSTSQAPPPEAPSTLAPSTLAPSTLSQDEAHSEERDHFDPNSLPVVSTQLKRRLTTHDDLISVLSAPNGRSRSIRSARSIRSNKSRMTATIPELLKELSADEVKYMRELKTLVGGVIPVLLTCVLSRSDSAIAAGLFRPSMDPKDELNFSKPIVDMGVAVERLKTLHKRIPEDNADALLTWAHGAQRVYREYLKAWRLGFRDVIVNLAPLDEGEGANNSDTKSLDEGMARDENGDVVDGDGEKVDVAYLLKRPLVRLKYLAKTFKGINTLQPSEKADEVAAAYQSLVTDARRRAREERERLEDESAACIDSTRARDPATLGPLAEVTIDKARRVRARDFFNLSLYHSSGQVIDCRAELLMRDASGENSSGGDLLICEIDHAERWLLLPPMDLSCVSARNGDTKGEIVVLLRSPPEQERRWQELLILRIDEEDVGFEWVQMLGLNPVPPAISRSQSFLERARQRQREQTPSSNDDTSLQKAPASPTGFDIPIGEKPNSRSLRRTSPREQLSDPSTVGSSLATDSRVSAQTAITRESDYALEEAKLAAKPSPQSQPSILHSRDPRRITIGNDQSPTGLKRSKAKRISRYDENAPPSPKLPKDPNLDATPLTPTTPQREQDEAKHAEQNTGATREKKTTKEQLPPKTPTRVTPDEASPRVSSVPSMDLPSIPKLRQGSSQTYMSESLADMSDEEDYDLQSLPESPTRRTKKSHSRTNSDSSDQANGEEPPPPPSHSRSPSSIGSSLPNTPVLSPSGVRVRRRGSSPLKHEYEPSTASDSYSDSDTSTVRRYDMYSESDYSGSDSSDDDSEDEHASLAASSLAPAKERDAPATSSLSPSNSASQGGYRTVPSQPEKSTTTMASVFAWSDKGSWDNVFPDDCRVIVSPGLIEAFEMKDAPISEDGTPSKRGRPVIALELTPLVPIRRGTAIDISIRSPPTERSRIAWSNNIMFRSRNPDECEILYGLINHARINNPTYIALQNARGPFADQPAAVAMEQPNKSAGLFGWPRRRKSYRASASPRSLADNSESSVGTMSSAFSALKRFGAGGKMFSISRSSVTSRSGPKEDSLYSDSTGSGLHHSPSSGLGRIAAAIKGVDGIGLSNAKIRLYVRETQTKWRDMGAARLTIMPSTPEPSRPDTAISGRSDPNDAAEGTDGSPPGSGTVSPRCGIEPEKRILVRGKTRNEVLLDVSLPESSFERVARTGIAVSVWEESAGGAMPKKGGVTGGFSRIYMIQMKSEAEATYTFGLVGKLRY